jgi:FtsP/CotA-like multicopper oxidase with cupredoxin domain
VKKIVALAAAAALVVAFAACKKEEKTAAPASKTAASNPAPKAAAMSGEVLETMNAGGYTYVKFKDDSGEHWAAGPATPVKVGDKVSFPMVWKIKGFESKTLKRTFDEIYFASAIVGPGGAAHAAPPPSNKEPVDLSGIKKAKGGLTVAEIHARRKDLNGKEVKVRGKVVKAINGIMGKNWLHIQDGSAKDKAGDLTVTTLAKASRGDTVLVSGKVVSDKDFGSGYRYEVIIEDAKVTVEETAAGKKGETGKKDKA